jgi:kynurenine formamidase
MKLIDVSVPLDVNLPTYPGNTPFSLETIKRIARGDETFCCPLRVVGSDGAPARVVLRRS